MSAHWLSVLVSSLIFPPMTPSPHVVSATSLLTHRFGKAGRNPSLGRK